jgi:hypothetical protein
VRFTRIRHEWIFPPFVSLMPSSTLCHLFQALFTFRDLPPLFSTVFDDKEQIGPISGNITIPNKWSTINCLRRLISVPPTEDSTTNRKNTAAPARACKIYHKKWILIAELIA